MVGRKSIVKPLSQTCNISIHALDLQKLQKGSDSADFDDRWRVEYTEPSGYPCRGAVHICRSWTSMEMIRGEFRLLNYDELLALDHDADSETKKLLVIDPDSRVIVIDANAKVAVFDRIVYETLNEVRIDQGRISEVAREKKEQLISMLNSRFDIYVHE